MKELWIKKNTTSNGNSEPAAGQAAPGLAAGQTLAVGVSLAVLAVALLSGPVFANLACLLAPLALLLCAWRGGRGSVLTATLLLAGGGLALGARRGLPILDSAASGIAILLLGGALGAIAERVRRGRAAADQVIASQKNRMAILESGLETVSDALVVINEAGVIQSFSPAAERLFGWTAEEMVGRKVDKLMPEAYAREHDGYIENYLTTGERKVIGSYRQVSGLRKDGTEFPMELRIGEVRVGSQRFFTGVVRDLTTAREAERRSEELHAQLTQIWSLNSMGEMASVLAHELNQPLSAVANYLRAARTLIANMELEDDDLIDAVGRAGDQAVRAGEIIRTMRDLATRGGALQQPESLSAIIREVDFIVSLMARDANVRVFYDLHKGDDAVMADRIQIQQLMVNLVRNAIEAVTKYPNRQLNISTRPDADGHLLTTVEDSGPGIEPALADRLFQPLASTKPEGMGLGLSISSAIVENHRGRIWVEPSRLGGAAFCFVLARAGNNGDDARRRTDGVRRR